MRGRNIPGGKNWLYPFLGVVLIWVIFLVRGFNGQTALAGLLEHDIGFQWIPFKEFARFCYQKGYFPLWCPYLFAGMPFLAFSHTQPLYPLGFILTFFDYAKAVNFFYPLHLTIGFWGLYLLLRNLKIKPLASFLASLSTILTCKFFYFIHFLPSASSNFWGIWFFYFLVKLSQKGKFKYLLGAGVSLALQFLGGDFESSAYLLFFTPFFLLFLWSWGKSFNLKLWLYFLVSVFFGLVLAGGQFLPLFEYSGFFLRKAGFTFSAFEWRTLPIEISWGLLFPLKELHTLGMTSPAPYLYLGLMGIFFPFYALLREKRWWGLFALSGLVLLFSFGSLRFLDWLVYHLPLLNRFGAQEHSFFLFQVFWAILMGAGLERALKDKWGILLFFAFSLAVVIFGEIFFETLGYRKILVFALLLGALVNFRGGALYSKIFIPSTIFLIFLIDVYFPGLKYLPKNSPALYRLPRELKSVQRIVKKSPGRAIIISRLGINDPILLHQLGLRIQLGMIDGWITTPPFTYAKFLNLIEPRSVKFKQGKIDGIGFNVHLREGKFLQAETLPLINLLSLRYFLVRGMNLKFASPFLFRAGEQGENSTPTLTLPSGRYFSQKVYSEKPDIFKTQLSASGKGAFFQLGFNSGQENSLLYARAIINSGDSSRAFKISSPLKKSWGKVGEFIFFNLPISQGWGELELFEPRIENPRKKIQRIRSNEIEIYENQQAFPQAYLVHNCEVFKADEQILARLKNSYAWELERKIYLSSRSPTAKIVRKVAEELQAQGIDPRKLKEPIYLKVNLPDRLVFLLRLVRPGYLFLNHQYLPGWRVYVDGREWRIERANYCFRAVFLDKGSHQVEFRYQPVGFAIGLYLSLASLFFVFLISGAYLFKKGKT